MSRELSAQSQNHIVRSFVGYRGCNKDLFTEGAFRRDLFALADIVELQIAVVASHARTYAFRNDVDFPSTASPGRLYA